MKRLLLLFIIFLSTGVFAQIGGNYSFPFIDLSYNARSLGLGGDFITGRDQDINMGIENPSLLNSEMNSAIGFNHALMAGGINYGMVNYGYDLSFGTMATYIKYVSYGTMDRTAINGIKEGTFSPIEMVVGSGVGKTINKRLSVGANLNFIYSQLETYNAFGASIDFAGTIRDDEKGYLVTALAKHVGVQFDSYVQDGQRNSLPIEFQLAGAYKIPHAPFRFTVLAHHLNTWDLSYTDPDAQPTVDALTGDTIPVPKAGFAEKLGRHFTIQLETIIGKNIHLRTAFDFNRRKELALATRPGAAGLSFGLGLYFKKFSLDYGFMIYSRAGFNNMITLSTHLSEWRK